MLLFHGLEADAGVVHEIRRAMVTNEVAATT
jgi:hypothetical protein